MKRHSNAGENMTEYRVEFNEHADELQAYEVLHDINGAEILVLVARGPDAEQYRNRGWDE